MPEFNTKARGLMALPDRLALWRFLAENGCWIWTGHRNPNGYGAIKIHGRQAVVHRAAWLAFKGPLPEPPLQVLHTCDNRACFNPEHLYVGDVSANQRDRYSRTGGHKLRAAHVQQIRARLGEGLSAKVVAEEFGIRPKTVLSIKSGHRWGWLR